MRHDIMRAQWHSGAKHLTTIELIGRTPVPTFIVTAR